MSTSDSISKSRLWVIALIVMIACVVAVAFGLSLGLWKDDKEDNKLKTDCHKPVRLQSSSRLTKDSPIYVEPTKMNEGFYRFASVSTDARICSYYGTETMVRHGGSAVDAAIVSILCNGVYSPQSCGIGGGFFMTYYKRSESKGYAIIAREMAPGAATTDMYSNKNVSSRRGGMSIGIPGEIKGLHEAWKLGGKLPWSKLFAPIIYMCKEGFPVRKRLSNGIHNYLPDQYKELKHLFTNPDTGEKLKEGETLKLPKLGETLERIAADPYTYYNGSLADDIIADIAESDGIITKDDLATYTATVVDPLTLDLSGGDYRVMSPPPPSSGAVILLILNILDGFYMNANSVSTCKKAAETYHRITEAFKFGFSVRTKLGDIYREGTEFKDAMNELLNNITSSSWGTIKRGKITYKTHDASYYEPTYSLDVPNAGTSHVSVIGPEGDAVSITSTVNLYFGSKIVGKRTGIVFNGVMEDFSTPNTTNIYGVPASIANYIKPFKRPLSSMSPTIVLDKDGDVKLVTGATGGTMIITLEALNIIQTLMLKLGLKESTEFPRLHHQLFPSELQIERAMPQVIVDGLKSRGHKLVIRDRLDASVQAILIMAKQKDSIQNILDGKRTNIVSFSDPIRNGIADGV